MGKISLALVICMAIVYCASIDGVNGAEKTCKAIVADLTKRQLGGIAKCNKSLKFKNGKDKAAKANCVLKCVMMNENILTDKGLLESTNINTFIEKEFPEELRDKVNKLFLPCVDDFGSKIDPAEEFCKSYEPMIKCVMGKLPLFCAAD